jgi:hypothetical protein
MTEIGNAYDAMPLGEQACHTIGMLDISGSMVQAGLIAPMAEVMNQVLAASRRQDGFLSLTYFNADLYTSCWRTPALQIPDLCAKHIPAGGNTALYDAIVATLARLKHDVIQSHGENQDIHVMIWTDGHDTSSRASALEAQFALAEARQSGWRISFVTCVQGLAEDLCLRAEETHVVHPTREGITRGIRTACTATMPTRMLTDHLTATGADSAPAAPCRSSLPSHLTGSTVVTATIGNMPAPAPAPITAVAQGDRHPSMTTKRAWWKFWS